MTETKKPERLTEEEVMATIGPKRGRPPKAPEAKVEAPKEPENGKPLPFGADAFINLKGRAYLPARRRVQWFRGPDIEPHPDWTIDTEVMEFERGKYIRPGRVEGGFVVFRANIFNGEGRLIATGVKTEYSENFADFLEKAETGAIARALAIAGYGTESALDLDEGLDIERVADSPVALPGVSITPSPTAPSAVARGGRTASSNEPQIRAVSKLSKALGLGPAGVATVIEQVLGATVPDLSNDPAEASEQLVALFNLMSGEDIGKVITALQKAQEARGEPADPMAGGPLRKVWEEKEEAVAPDYETGH